MGRSWWLPPPSPAIPWFLKARGPVLCSSPRPPVLLRRTLGQPGPTASAIPQRAMTSAADDDTGSTTSAMPRHRASSTASIRTRTPAAEKKPTRARSSATLAPGAAPAICADRKPASCGAVARSTSPATRSRHSPGAAATTSQRRLGHPHSAIAQQRPDGLAVWVAGHTPAVAEALHDAQAEPVVVRVVRVRGPRVPRGAVPHGDGQPASVMAQDQHALPPAVLDGVAHQLVGHRLGALAELLQRPVLARHPHQ